MDSQMELLFKAVNQIQDEVINVALINKEKYDNLEEIITDVTYEMAYKLFELVDGYYNKNVKYRMIETHSNVEITNDYDLHNLCEEFLKCTDK